MPELQADADLESGTLLAHRYRVQDEIGRGAMGAVYRAQDTLLEIDVALKIVPRFLSASTWAMKALKREARMAMRLAHPNVLRVHTLEEAPEATFLVMEYVDGYTLAQRVRMEGRLPLEAVLPTAEQVAAGLDYAHGQSVLHRDVKPSNILVNTAGVAKLADFGVAREMKVSTSRLLGHEISGTLLYMSPEQLMAEKTDERSDIYSFAAVLYECLAGTPPFDKGPIVALAKQILEQRPADLDGVPPHVNEAIQLALAKEPLDRPSTASDLVARLRGPRA